MYKVEVSHAGDYTFKVKSKDSAFIIDTQGKGVTPPDTLLASLGSCIGVYPHTFAESPRL